MTAKEIFRKTMPFNMAKLGLGALTILLSVLLLVVLMGIGWLFGGGGMFVTFLIWLFGTGGIRFVIMHYLGYLVKAGHVAVIAEAVTTGRVPDQQVAYGKARVAERFATSNVYFAVDKLVSSAVKQIQRGVQKVGNALDFVPGMKAVSGLAQFFVGISLGYIDECCLGYTFYKKDQGAFKSAADGVVIYAQNWKLLLGNAARTMAKVMILSLLVLLAVFIPVGLIFKLLHWNAFIAFLLACLIVWMIKFALIDSYIMIQMMTAYMGAAPGTQITFDLYGKLCKLSVSFKELWNKGREDAPQPACSRVGGTVVWPEMAGERMEVAPNGQRVPKPVFCGQCGAKNEAGTKFCGSCGSKLG